MKNGAILDIAAALILKEHGIDTGIISVEDGTFDYEYYPEADEKIRDIENNALKKIQCNPNAKVLSTFLPGDSPASYLYENASGLKFLVLAHDLFFSDKNPSYLNNYCRQAQFISSAEWLCCKKLPAVCTKNPNLYVLASKCETGMSVALLNVNVDEITEPVIKLDKNYTDINFVNCCGKLDGDTVYLSEIQPYGFAAFEIK